MKIKNNKLLKDGNTLVTVSLSPGEKLISIEDHSYYLLGGQHNDIVSGHIITEAIPVFWDSLTQKWEEEK